MKSLMMFLQCVLNDLGTRCGTSTTLDLKTIKRRCEHEGELPFLGISLAKFGKDFEKSLDQGFVGHDQFMGFARTGGLPRLFGGFLDQVFDRRSGRLLDEPSVDAIYAVRQLTLMWAKISMDCTPERVNNAYSSFAECEREVRRADQGFLPGSDPYRAFARLGRLLWADLFSSVDNQIYNVELVPRHGKGATADKLSGNQKFTQHEWTERLDRVFPHWEQLIPNPGFLDRISSVTLREPGAERPVRVITVPKTLDKPRIIAVEPTCMQYMQQALLTTIRQEMRANDHARNFVLFDRQEPNQILAMQGSKDGTLATLDLSEASDRVSNQHVRALLQPHRHLFDAVDAVRSRKAEILLDGQKKIIRLAKFASMGSALTFPMEAIVFTTVIFLGIEKELNRRLTAADIKSFYGRVRVYGDDIIVPVDYVQSVVQELESFGFRVNRNKSFWNGKFRESCGRDYYDGNDVSVVRVREVFPNDRTDVAQIVSTVSLRNQLFHAGFVEAVEYLDNLVQRIIPFPTVPWRYEEDSPTYTVQPSFNDDWIREVDRPFPTHTGKRVIQSSPVLGRHSWGPCQPTHYDRNLHLPLVRGAVVHAKSPINMIDDYAALMKWFLMRGEQPFADKDHLLRSGRPDSAYIKIRRVALR